MPTGTEQRSTSRLPDDATSAIAGRLERHGDRIAVVTPTERLTYRPLLLTPTDPGVVARLAEAYDPDVVVGVDGAVEERRAGTAHALHPDLTLLLSTSGSTGSPKLVRLSHRNLDANAEAIADYLGLRADDCAATLLPLHCCYGLSVVHSHLLRGARLVGCAAAPGAGPAVERWVARLAVATRPAAVPPVERGAVRRRPDGSGQPTAARARRPLRQTRTRRSAARAGTPSPRRTPAAAAADR